MVIEDGDLIGRAPTWLHFSRVGGTYTGVSAFGRQCEYKAEPRS